MAEVNRKKQQSLDARNQLAQNSATTASDTQISVNVQSKYIRQGDRKRLLDEEREREQERLKQERESKNAAFQKDFEDRSQKKLQLQQQKSQQQQQQPSMLKS